MSEYDEALVRLGEALQSVGWSPGFPLGDALDAGDRDPKDRWRVIALLYIAANRFRLYPVLCSKGAVRESVRLGSEMVAHVSAHLAGLDWIEAVLVAPLASALCVGGLDDFCRQGPEARS